MATVSEIRQAVESFHKEIAEIMMAADARALHWQKDENTWSVAQILAHVAEFERFFADDIRRLHNAPGSRFGRTMEHEQRLQAVELTGTETVQSLLARCDASREYLTDVLTRLTDADLSIEGVNPKFGTKSILWVIDHFIVEHLEKHIGQIQRTYGAYPTA